MVRSINNSIVLLIRVSILVSTKAQCMVTYFISYNIPNPSSNIQHNNADTIAYSALRQDGAVLYQPAHYVEFANGPRWRDIRISPRPFFHCFLYLSRYHSLHPPLVLTLMIGASEGNFDDEDNLNWDDIDAAYNPSLATPPAYITDEGSHAYEGATVVVWPRMSQEDLNAALMEFGYEGVGVLEEDRLPPSYLEATQGQWWARRQ
ncbi:hypothetical protein EJ04DRAFT_568595 [Polyplosphaeria fusca]|uniref:Uncharacterized protein n=1 Tax=Polyplosphaeria fusca TaxID=682080 RepID=A0A9P4UV26_9PLEO|nr:hypothetical protein EJ04DRAFT_568595 [Polyplosphaeria fusca]